MKSVDNGIGRIQPECREMYDQIQSDLQMIASLMSIQNGFLGHDETAQKLKDSQNRILAFSSIYPILLTSEEYTKVNLK